MFFRFFRTKRNSVFFGAVSSVKKATEVTFMSTKWNPLFCLFLFHTTAILLYTIVKVY